MHFDELLHNDDLLDALYDMHFDTATPIQEQSIPPLLEGHDLLAVAQTGTGKTAAYLLPVIEMLVEDGYPQDRVNCVVMAPTRELAQQIDRQMQGFSYFMPVTSMPIYGGTDGRTYEQQRKGLKQGADVIIATPGRLLAHLSMGYVDLSKVSFFILDEADRMLDMGFIDDIEHIFEQANPDARILLFSATMPAPILKIAAKFMGEYEIVEEEGVVEEPLLIDQKYWVVRESDKVEALVRLIDSNPNFYGLVFTQTKNDADTVSKRLDEKGYDVAALHGDIPQSQREKILARFRSKKTRVLVATDVAARGIDISGLSHVVNYSLPFDATTYVHRIGRTGRAGSSGFAVTFVTPGETRKLNFLKARVARASKGDLNEGEVPSVKNVLKVKQAALFDELKKSLGLKKEIEIDENSISENEISSNENSSEESQVENPENQISENENLSSENSADEISTENSENLNPNSENENPIEKKSNLIQVDSMFVEMARELCENDEAEKVLAAVLSVMYGKKLSKKRYDDISKSALPKSKDSARRDRGGFGGRDFEDSDPNQKRLYIQLGRRDGYNAREIADYFSGILNIPEKLVDRIDVSTNFSLVSLPISDADRMLEMAGKDSSIPHIHVDAKPAGGGRGGRRGGFGGRDFDDDFGERRRGGRRGFGRDRDFGRSRGFDRDRDFGRRSSRPNPHTPTERSGRSSFFKSKRAKEF